MPSLERQRRARARGLAGRPSRWEPPRAWTTGPRFAKLPALLEQLPANVDYVIVDTPPALLVAGMADLAQSVDAVIVVVRHGGVHRRRLRALGRQARSWRARLLGAVLNDAPGQDGYVGYYYGRP